MQINDLIGVAILGAGRMGQTHLRNLSGLPGVKVVVVAEPKIAAAEQGQSLCGAERALADPEEAIHLPRVDAVVIVTPTDTHARLIELAAAAGKAIFSEKPIALDLEETARVVGIVNGKGVPLQLGFMRRFDPGYAAAKQKIDAGELGRVETFRALSRDTYPPGLKFLKSSGGLFLDMAVHDFDLARFLVGEVEEVQAWGTVLIDERFSQADDVDTAVTLLRFANGALGVIETSRRSNWGYNIVPKWPVQPARSLWSRLEKRRCYSLRILVRVSIISRISLIGSNRLIASNWSRSFRLCAKVNRHLQVRMTPWKLCASP